MAELLHIDWTACEGRGLCVELLPEVLDRDEWGYPIPRDGSREPVVPDEILPHARSAVKDCPRLALRLKPTPAATRPGATPAAPAPARPPSAAPDRVVVGARRG